MRSIYFPHDVVPHDVVANHVPPGGSCFIEHDEEDPCLSNGQQGICMFLAPFNHVTRPFVPE